MKVVIFNSPPQSGKDDSVTFLKSKYKNIHHCEFKAKLINIVCELYDITRDQFDLVYTNQTKDEPCEYFDGMTPRAALIYVAEKIVKPAFGKDYFGKHACKSLQAGKINVFTDGGFYDELKPVIDVCGAANATIVEIVRDGKSFDEDARSLVAMEGVERMIVQNNSELNDLFCKIDELFTYIAGSELERR